MSVPWNELRKLLDAPTTSDLANTTIERIVPMPCKREVVRVVPIQITPYVEMLECNHAGRVLFVPLEDAEARVGRTRECIVCKRGKP